MADYSNSKKAGNGNGIYPENVQETTFGRLEPVLGAELLRTRFLFGIPLVSKFKDPETGKPFRITDDMLQDYIEIAIDEAENETGLTIMPVQFSEGVPYSRMDWNQLQYLQLQHRPVSSVERWTVRLADGNDIFDMPSQWWSVSNAVTGQLNLVPLIFSSFDGGAATIGSSSPNGAGTALFWSGLMQRDWVPALWNITYTAGFKDGLVPRIVNTLIGTIAAQQVLSQLAATFARSTSTSLGIDGLSQSIGTPGPQIYMQRITELQAQRKLCVKKLRKTFQTNFVTTAL